MRSVKKQLVDSIDELLRSRQPLDIDESVIRARLYEQARAKIQAANDRIRSFLVADDKKDGDSGSGSSDIASS